MENSDNLEERVSAYRFISAEKGRVYIGIGILGPRSGITNNEYRKILSRLKSAKIAKNTYDNQNGKPYITLDLEIETFERRPRNFSYKLMINDIIDFLSDLNVEDINIRDIDDKSATTNSHHGKQFVHEKYLTNQLRNKNIELILAEVKQHQHHNGPKEIYLLGLKIPQH